MQNVRKAYLGALFWKKRKSTIYDADCLERLNVFLIHWFLRKSKKVIGSKKDNFIFKLLTINLLRLEF